jgi:hypothetical protein
MARRRRQASCSQDPNSRLGLSFNNSFDWFEARGTEFLLRKPEEGG